MIARGRLIRETFRQYAHTFDFNNGQNVWRVPLLGPVEVSSSPVRLEDMQSIQAYLEYRLVYGKLNGRDTYSIICEGIIVETGWADDR